MYLIRIYTEVPFALFIRLIHLGLYTYSYFHLRDYNQKSILRQNSS